MSISHIGQVATTVCRTAARRRQLLDHLRHLGAVRVMAELLGDLGRSDADLMRADLDALEADGLVWRRDITWAPQGRPITETCWWAPRVPFLAGQETAT